MDVQVHYILAVVTPVRITLIAQLLVVAPKIAITALNLLLLLTRRRKLIILPILITDLSFNIRELLGDDLGLPLGILLVLQPVPEILSDSARSLIWVALIILSDNGIILLDISDVFYAVINPHVDVDGLDAVLHE